MGGLHLEGAVLGPQVDRVGDAGATSLVHHLGRFGSGDVEFEVGVLLPVAEEERELEQEAVVGVAQGGQGLRAGVAAQAAVEGLACPDQLFPALEVVRIGVLSRS